MNEIAICKACGSARMEPHHRRGDHSPAHPPAFHFQCHGCGAETPKRRTPHEAEQDVKWQPIGGGRKFPTIEDLQPFYGATSGTAR